MFTLGVISKAYQGFGPFFLFPSSPPLREACLPSREAGVETTGLGIVRFFVCVTLYYPSCFLFLFLSFFCYAGLVLGYVEYGIDVCNTVSLFFVEAMSWPGFN